MTSASSNNYTVDVSDDESAPSVTMILIPKSTSMESTKSTLKNPNSLSKLHDKSEPRGQLMIDVSRRLKRRRTLHYKLTKLTDIMCFLGTFGIVFMIIENEITFINGSEQDSLVCVIFKSLITITTLILVCLVFYYHRLDLELNSVNNALDHWRIGLTTKKKMLVLLEALICLIHPIPRSIHLIWNSKESNSTQSVEFPANSIPLTLSHIDIDVALGLPMFARIYLICRFIMLHSNLVGDCASQSLGYLNEVSINFFFLVKTYLEEWPATYLSIFCVVLFVIGSWSLRACNYVAMGHHASLLDSMWLFIVTFTTVGYGDFTPTTYCGRSVAAMIGLIGVLSTALLISVLAQKLELTRPEKYLHTFVLKSQLAKQQKNQAANVLKFALKVWITKKNCSSNSTEFIKAQRQLRLSIHLYKRLKKGQLSLNDNCLGITELVTIQRDTNNKTHDNFDHVSNLNTKIDKIEHDLIDINNSILNIQQTLRLLLDRLPT